RDLTVTGVQTCALPISALVLETLFRSARKLYLEHDGPHGRGAEILAKHNLEYTRRKKPRAKACLSVARLPISQLQTFLRRSIHRSEERRVGKECRSRWS